MTETQKLATELKNLAKYGSALAVLGWDEEVNLPKQAHAYRGEVSAMLSAELHNKFTSPKLYKLVQKLSSAGSEALSADDIVLVRETKRDIDLARKLPTDFVETLSLLTTRAFSLWVKARSENDFSIFSPVLREIVEMKKREAEMIGYKDSPYDALLDEYEPGMNVKKIDAVFEPLAKSLSGLISSARSSKIPDLPSYKYPLDKQEKLNLEVAQALGYDLGKGRVDISPHPFTTTFHTTDVRITTRYDERDFWVSLGSTIHEVGHALYEQGLPLKHFGTPLGEAVSLGVHESQSRSWENFVGRSEAFSIYLYPILKSHFPGIEYGQAELYQWLNRVSPNLIRVESDEVTYNMHIILRYELEKALMQGDLDIADLPAAWNEKVKNYLGLDVPNDADGVLQDVHWSHGSIGYFPTYTLGNLYAAQLFNSYKTSLPQYEEAFSKGDFSEYLKWLRTNIHIHGRRFSPLELIVNITGEDLDSKYLLDHLAQKIEL